MESVSDRARTRFLLSLNLPGLRELTLHRITALSGKLKAVLHSQENGTNIFPSQLHDMSKLYVRFTMNINNFSKFSKIAQSFKRNFRRFAAIVPISQKV